MVALLGVKIGILVAAAWVGTLIAIRTGFPWSPMVLALVAVGLFVLSFVVTLLNPLFRFIFLTGAAVAVGAAVATAVWFI